MNLDRTAITQKNLSHRVRCIWTSSRSSRLLQLDSSMDCYYYYILVSSIFLTYIVRDSIASFNNCVYSLWVFFITAKTKAASRDVVERRSQSVNHLAAVFALCGEVRSGSLALLLTMTWKRCCCCGRWCGEISKLILACVTLLNTRLREYEFLFHYGC